MNISTEKRNQQAADLSKKIWDIANDLRGSMDSSKFKDYILGTIFYRYLSERTEMCINDLLKSNSISYAEAFSDPEFASTVRKWSLEHLGYIIEPDNLYSSLINKINSNEFTIENYENAINAITDSTIGQRSEEAFDNLFEDMNLQNKDLGRTISERTDLISKVILRINDIDIMLSEAQFDILGTAYMLLIGLFASNAGKKSGEYFTPASVSRLVALLATSGLTEVSDCCDPCAGSGSLLLEVRNCLPEGKVGHYWAQEKIGTTYNLTRMNMLMHGVDYEKFTVFNGDTLKADYFGDKMMPVQVSNPPYSETWSADKSFIDDPRFSGAGKLAPKSFADMAFLEHIIYHMGKNGQAAVLLSHGILFRGKAEETIRKYIIKYLNCLDAVIGLPPNLFHGATIAVVLLVLKAKRDNNATDICFIDASRYYTAGKNQNSITQEDVHRIVSAYEDRKDIDKFCHIAPMDEIIDNDYNLNIPRYVDSSDDEKLIDLQAVFSDISEYEKSEHEIDIKLNSYFKELGMEIEL